MKSLLKNMSVPTFIFLIFFILMLLYTRFVNLEWGLPYPMHPDERNMVLGILEIKCDTVKTFDCLNPEFFAYGQLPLFTAYFMVKAGQFLTNTTGTAVSYEEATMALRTIAAFCSLGTALFMYLTFTLLVPLVRKKKITAKLQTIDTRIRSMLTLLIIFVPGLIQLSHYGTTESLLMFTFTGLIYFALGFLQGKIKPWVFVAGSGVLTGIALASKVSALPFLGVPGGAMLVFYISNIVTALKTKKKDTKKILQLVGLLVGFGLLYTLISAVLGIGLSPFNVIALEDFMGSMKYETGVGFGDILVFYTRSFFMTTPIIFQMKYILPFVLGLPIFLFSLIGLFFLPWKKREFTFMRYAFCLVFIPQAIVYAKWTRFIAPVFPLMVIFAMIAMYWLYQLALSRWEKRERYIRYASMALILLATLPGLAYVSVYTKPDVRYVASEWMFKNIPENLYLLAETANVVDIPAPAHTNTAPLSYPTYRYISFDFYNLDTNPLLTPELASHIRAADYIIVNSRRVFKNHTCLEANELRYAAPISIDQTLPIPDPITNQAERCDALNRTYPQLQKYYSDLFSGKMGYTLVAEFTSYPDISFFGKPLIEFPDENAEETWAIFDHPVIRIYKKDTPRS